VILENKNVDIQTISDYTQLKVDLSKHGVSIEDCNKLLVILKRLKMIPKKTLLWKSHSSQPLRLCLFFC